MRVHFLFIGQAKVAIFPAAIIALKEADIELDSLIRAKETEQKTGKERLRLSFGLIFILLE